mmetsp:Transcript_14949/g.49014  ORF Transcript_14949/g.49014 Transcript_14949/m.49014 type:complete len:96 (-) Transcript_14949:1065-1352(-)
MADDTQLRYAATLAQRCKNEHSARVAAEVKLAAAEVRLKKLEEAQTCGICFTQAVGVAHVPCGHVACSKCSAALREDVCHSCRSPIETRLRLFFL